MSLCGDECGERGWPWRRLRIRFLSVDEISREIPGKSQSLQADLEGTATSGIDKVFLCSASAGRPVSTE